MSQSPLQSESATAGTVESLNSSSAYTVQVRCVNNDACTQCSWSREYDVPPGGSTFQRISSISDVAPANARCLIIGSLSELTTAPDLDEPEDGDAAELRGRRRLSLTWKVCNQTLLSWLVLFSVNMSLCVSLLPKMRTTATR